MVKLNSEMKAGTDAATVTDVQVNHVSQTIAKHNVSCRFNIDFFEFSFLVEACIPPRPIARAVFWQDVIDKYYNVLSQNERDNLFSWVNRNVFFEERIKEKNEDCLLFNARYEKSNQYKVKTNYKGEEKTIEAFKWQGKFHISKASSISPEFIIEVSANGS